MTRISGFLALVTVLLVACDSRPVSAPVVIYAPAADEAQLSKRFLAFTADTGIPVLAEFMAGGAGADRVVANEGSRKADVLMTDNVADIWRAADEGALRPIRSAALKTVPAVLRDADAFWIAVRYRSVVIAVADDAANFEAPDLLRLASPELKGKVCLLGHEQHLSRALIGMLIDELDSKPAERLVRGWVRNLARSPFDSEAALAAALESGECEYGILSDAAVGDVAGAKALPTPYYDIDAVGIGRHAGNADAAQVFVDWIISEGASQLPITSTIPVAVAGWRDEEAQLLAERAGYR